MLARNQKNIGGHAKARPYGIRVLYQTTGTTLKNNKNNFL